MFTTCNKDVGPMSRGSPTPMDPTRSGVSLSPPLPCYHPPLSLTCGSWCPAGGPLRSGHLQPGRGFGTRRNHSVSRAVLRRPERGCCALLPEHGVRRAVPIPQGAAPLLGVQRHLDKTRDGRKVTSQERGHQGSSRHTSGVGRQRPAGRVEG